MTSSTSSSEPAQPAWGRVWALALLIVVTVVGSWELLLRKASLGPDYDDTRALWAQTRHAINRDGENAIAIVGASRAQWGIDVEVLSGQLGRPVYQLALEGSSAISTLENLAVDPRFRGTVIYSIAPAITFNRQQRRVDFGRQREWLQYYLDQSQSRQIEDDLRLWFQGRFAFRSPHAAPSRVVPSLIANGELPEREGRTILGNRVTLFDFTKVDTEQTEAGMIAHYLEHSVPYEGDEWAASLDYFDVIVNVLRAKGVQVVFLRMPPGKTVGAFEDLFYPRRIFWDRMEERIDAIFINASDYSELDGYTSDDGSHVESDKIGEFTEVLAGVLVRAAQSAN